MNKRHPKKRDHSSDYEKEKDWIVQFLRQFEDPNYDHQKFGKLKYFCEIEKILKEKREFLEIHYEDLEEYFSGAKYKSFLENIKSNAKRYNEIFTFAAEELNLDAIREMTLREEIEDDLFCNQVSNFEENMFQENVAPKLAEENNFYNKNNLSKTLFKRKFQVAVVPGPNCKFKVQNLRDLKAEHIGSLVKVRGTVVRVTEVKPRMTLAAYHCTACSEFIYATVNGKEFTPPAVCQSQRCRSTRTLGNIVPYFQNSRFQSYQELRIQETTDQSPIGSVPRSFVVHLNGHTVRSCAPGDTVIIDGLFLPKLQEVYNHRDFLIHETFIEALKVEREKKSDSDRGPVSQKDINEFISLSKSSDIIKVLVKRIAPEIFGMESVKKALLLQMAGGSTINTGDGLRIRGDLNIALIGDPGIAKSQLLKHIAHLSPRGVYTTGKGSSGAGLTACIMRDPTTNEITLEGGALVLADLGICCIDEFDKMQDNDRVAIHEVMEQQTISLAKAGITTSLNARASILAAANPVYGRYDRNKSPHENIGLPYSLLSRFDLIYILLDKSNEAGDMRIAQHITMLHQKNRVEENPSHNISPKLLQDYVHYARTLQPKLTEDLHDYIVKRYVQKRKSNKDLGKFGQYITPRTLLAVIRFAIAAAKLRLSQIVEQDDIETALELMDLAQISVMTEEEEKKNKFTGKVKVTENEQIKHIINECFMSSSFPWVDMNSLTNRCLHHGFSKDQVAKCITEHINNGFYMLQDDDTKLVKMTTSSNTIL